MQLNPIQRAAQNPTSLRAAIEPARAALYDGWRDHSDAIVSRHMVGATVGTGGSDTLRMRVGYRERNLFGSGRGFRAEAMAAIPGFG